MDEVDLRDKPSRGEGESSGPCPPAGTDSPPECVVAGEAIQTCTPAEGAVVPLPRLLADAEALFAAEFDSRVRHSEFPSLSLAHARNVLRHLGAEPRRASALVADCGVSKQALSQQIAHLEQAGLVTVRADPGDARARLLTLTPRGHRAQQLVRRLFVEIEDEWALDCGQDDLAAIRRTLSALLSRRRAAPC